MLSPGRDLAPGCLTYSKAGLSRIFIGNPMAFHIRKLQVHSDFVSMPSFFAGWLRNRTGTIRTVFPETESGTGTAGTVFQEPKPEPSFPVKLY